MKKENKKNQVHLFTILTILEFGSKYSIVNIIVMNYLSHSNYHVFLHD